MVPFIIYWGVILACIAWLVLSIYFSIFYLVRKENGNLWAFAFFNVLAAIVFSHYFSCLPNLGLGHHTIFKFDLFSISNIWCNSYSTSNLRPRAKGCEQSGLIVVAGFFSQ